MQGRGGGGRFDGGRGATPCFDWRQHPERNRTKNTEDELDDTISSPSKPNAMEITEIESKNLVKGD